MQRLFLVLLFCSAVFQLAAQDDPEFKTGFILHLKLHNGMVTNFNSFSPDQYIGGIQLVPQYVFVKNKIRGGLIGNLFYTGKKLQAAFGPTVSLKLKTFKAGQFGSIANIHVNFDYLIGTSQQRLLGGGFNADVLNKLILGLSVYRDYHLNTWWLQNSLAIRIGKTKNKKGPLE